MKMLSGLLVLVLLSVGVLTGCQKDEPALSEHPDHPDAAAAAEQIPKDHPAH